MTSAVCEDIAIRIVTDGRHLDQVRTLLRGYNDHLVTFINPALLQHRETELASLPANFLPPHGALFLATSADQPLGCAGLRPVSLPDQASPAEFCRLWVTPAARGRSLGWQLLQAAIAFARAAGHTAIVLNSASGSMASAQSLYTRAGFVRVPPYKHVAIPNIEFFRLDLTR